MSPFCNQQETTDNKSIRELRDSVKDLKKSTDFSSKVMIVLTIFIIILTLALIYQGVK